MASDGNARVRQGEAGVACRAPAFRHAVGCSRPGRLGQRHGGPWRRRGPPSTASTSTSASTRERPRPLKTQSPDSLVKLRRRATITGDTGATNSVLRGYHGATAVAPRCHGSAMAVPRRNGTVPSAILRVSVAF